jgi:hypothetical protein
MGWLCVWGFGTMSSAFFGMAAAGFECVNGGRSLEVHAAGKIVAPLRMALSIVTVENYRVQESWYFPIGSQYQPATHTKAGTLGFCYTLHLLLTTAAAYAGTKIA